jgi:SPP1 gp7 family putative phage head morphogenesis protein
VFVALEDGVPGGVPPSVLSVPFDDAIEWHRKRLPLTDEAFAAMKQRAAARAFTIAGVAQLDLVKDAFAGIDKAVAKGTTLQDFKNEIGPQLRDAWAGSVANPPARMENIFRTNVGVAYGAGRWAQAQDPDVIARRPYWKFVALLDPRTSEICRPLNGKVIRADDAWWKSHLPPLHFQCRSTFTTLTEEQAKKAGITETPPKSKPMDGFGDAPGSDGAREQELVAQKIADAPAELQPVAEAKLGGGNGGAGVPPGGGGGGDGGGERPEKDPVKRVPAEHALQDWGVSAGRFASASDAVARLTKVFPEGVPTKAELERMGAGLRDGWKFDLTDARPSWEGDGTGVATLFTIRDDHNVHVAEVVRSFMRVNGDLVVNHDRFFLPEAMQNMGIAKEVVPGMLREYERLGVANVTIHAVDVGRYSWSSMGFAFDAESEHRVKAGFLRFLRERGLSMKDAAVQKLVEQPWKLAQYESDNGQRLGKEFLLGVHVSDWFGSMSMKPPSKGYKYAKKKFKL